MSEDEARRPPVRVDQMTFDRLIRIADRLGRVQAGNAAADQAIYQALNRSGPVLAYTVAEDAAQSLLPAGFELLPATYAGGAVYAACRRSGTDGKLPQPHHGQWGTTLPLAICGVCLRVHEGLDQDRRSARTSRALF
ncbi:hypothetical protein E2C06_35805 [Dankookia rubra]|uniref:Uncharacterized protein n=1 Tax=Dankookia rubra TaxID=1442381 RepID=A0A4R5Q519_9PROT|nr:hypothetical protein [Dankookia rubra]TDH57609.1 hypothetical protein E2C06_35805 [Dankookia rubra]